MPTIYAIDCEMVALVGHQSGLARVCIIDESGEILFDTFCYQDPNDVLDYRTHISGITHKDLEHAPPFDQIRQQVLDMIQDGCVIGHSIDNDLRALRITLPPEQIIDVADIPMFRAGKNRRKLKDLAKEYVGIEIQQGNHNPIEDARAALQLALVARGY